MDRFVTRAPTWKTLEMSSFSRSFANVSLTGKKSTPKVDKAQQYTNKRLSILDENLMKIFTSQPDEPLMIPPTQDLSPYAARFNGSFGASELVNRDTTSKQSIRLVPSDENTPPPNAQITSVDDDPIVGNVMRISGESSSRPSTPISNMIPANLGQCTAKDHPFLARIQRDLNSPSAATRVRALKALRSPTKSAYANFDIPHEEQDIITEEERRSPKKAKSIQELMKDVVVYVEVRTGEDNRSSGVKKVISALGAKVNDKLLRDTTHVVFKDGLQSTYNKAKKWNIPIVSILWIEACKKQMKLMSPKDFPISNADRYENPELYDKMKRYKSMQPDAEENRRQRAKAQTKENALKPKQPQPTTSVTNSTKKKTDITRFFSNLDKTKSTPDNNRSIPATPTTQMLQRINENFCTPNDSLRKLAFLDTVSTLSDTNELSSKMSDAKKMLDFEIENSVASTFATTKTPSRRRNSIQVTQTPKQVDNNLTETPDHTAAAAAGLRTRRRSSIHIPTNIQRDEDKSTKNTFASIREETVDDVSEPKVQRQTTFTEKSVDITNTVKSNKTNSARRRTLYTPTPMEESSLKSTKKAIAPSNRRRTLFTPSSKPFASDTMEMSSTAPLTPIPDGIPCSTLIGEESVKTPVPLGSLLEEHAAATIFSSTKTPMHPGRRTLFDVSMDIISQRLQNINQSAKSVRNIDDPQNKDRRSSQDDPETIAALLTPTDNANKIRRELFTGVSNSIQKSTTPVPPTPLQTIAASTTATTPGEALTKKKRKLFVPNEVFLTPPPQPTSAATDSDESTSSTKRPRNVDTPSGPSTATTKTKRRRTIMPTLAQSKPEQKKPASKMTGSRPSRRSTMDFEAIKKAKKAVIKTSGAHQSVGTTVAPVTNGRDAKPYPFLVYTNMHTEQIEFIKEAISKIPGFNLEDNVSDNTTHIVSLEPRRTINLLRGLVRGLWILNYDWIVDSVNAGRWLSEEQYELREFSRAVEICRSERQAFGSGYKMSLFCSLGPFYISSQCSVPKENLKELVTLCAGRLADRKSRAKYIIGDACCEPLPGKFYLNPQWILDSISNNQIQKFTKYFINHVTEKEN